MQQPEIAALLWDMERAAAAIQDLAKRHTLADYRSLRWLRSSIEREFIIIGEALGTIRRVQPDLAQQFSGANAIIAFRNILVHGYSVVNPDSVWQNIQDGLPTLLSEIRALLPSG
jgi:uncharacterized protein with HEPN domain